MEGAGAAWLCVSLKSKRLTHVHGSRPVFKRRIID